MNRKEIKFLWNRLTDFTHTYGQENQVIKIITDLVSIPFQKDEYGNYFIKVGNSNSLFVAHLDNAVKQKLKVTKVHYKKDDRHFIKTDGLTILGADDKTGIVIMLNMIEQKVPGLYYFFIGEEVGLVGSLLYHKNKTNIFQNIDRCVAFDRKGYGSIINRMKGSDCCSNEFVDALSSEFRKNGLKFKADPYGVGTDSASFMGIVAECVNLSVGYFNEHTYNEEQDMDYLLDLAEASTKIDWENLPVVRIPEAYDSETPKVVKKEETHLPEYKLQNIFSDVYSGLRSKLHVYCSNHSLFQPNKEMKFYQLRDLENLNKFSMVINWDGSVKFLRGDNEIVYDTYQELLDFLDKKGNKKLKKILDIKMTAEEIKKEEERQKAQREKFKKDVSELRVALINGTKLTKDQEELFKYLKEQDEMKKKVDNMVNKYKNKPVQEGKIITFNRFKKK